MDASLPLLNVPFGEWEIILFSARILQINCCLLSILGFKNPRTLKNQRSAWSSLLNVSVFARDQASPQSLHPMNFASFQITAFVAPSSVLPAERVTGSFFPTGI